jgi:hypothetical protein
MVVLTESSGGKIFSFLELLLPQLRDEDIVEKKVMKGERRSKE